MTKEEEKKWRTPSPEHKKELLKLLREKTERVKKTIKILEEVK